MLVRAEAHAAHWDGDGLAEEAQSFAFRIKNTFGVTMHMTIEPPGSLERSQGKAKRVRGPETQMTDPVLSGEYDADLATCLSYWRTNQSSLDALPAKPQRSAGEAAAAKALYDGGSRRAGAFSAKPRARLSTTA